MSKEQQNLDELSKKLWSISNFFLRSDFGDGVEFNKANAVFYFVHASLRLLMLKPPVSMENEAFIREASEKASEYMEKVINNGEPSNEELNALLVKYIYHVGQNEGTDFLREQISLFTDREWELLNAASEKSMCWEIGK